MYKERNGTKFSVFVGTERIFLERNGFQHGTERIRTERFFLGTERIEWERNASIFGTERNGFQPHKQANQHAGKLANESTH